MTGPLSPHNVSLVDAVARTLAAYDRSMPAGSGPDEHHRMVARAVLDVLDLPGRDDRVRADTLRWAAREWETQAGRVRSVPAENLGQMWQRQELAGQVDGVADWLRAAADGTTRQPGQSPMVCGRPTSGERCARRAGHRGPCLTGTEHREICEALTARRGRYRRW